MEIDNNNDYKLCLQELWNILAEKSVKVDEKFILNLQKESKNVSCEVKNSCKILHFSSEWNFEDILSTIDGLNTKDYPQLFIFIIDASYSHFLEAATTSSEPLQKKMKTSNENIEKMKENLLKFGLFRPLILELTSQDSNKTEFYFKNENMTEFTAINQIQKENSKIIDFSNGNLVNFEFLREIKNSTIILKFLRTLKIQEEAITRLILNATKSCTLTEFLALLDAPFEGEHIILSFESQGILSNVFNQETLQLAEDDHSLPNVLNLNYSVSSAMDFECDLGNSVLLIAVEHKNKEVIDHLISYWTYLIQQLPFDHQVKISTAAYETNQLDVLCDLLDIADFPFPEDFKVNYVNHDGLSKTISQRSDFKAAIETENFEKLEEFISQNLRLKIVYNINNKSAINHAIDSKKSKVYLLFVSAGFQPTEAFNIQELLSQEEFANFKNQIKQQEMENINSALQDKNKSVMLLSTRSLIHNRRIKNKTEAEYRLKIKQWFEDINKLNFGPELLNVAASCENLKIIFNFESATVYQIDLKSENALGLTRNFKIFIGAKFLDKKREQQIKGILAHELCHYVMRLVYQNSFLPYYKYPMDIRDEFDEIVKLFDSWFGENSEKLDDECNKIISSVYTLYPSTSFHCELIVRVMHILAEFDDDKDKIESLQVKYKILFNFWENKVVPDLKSFNLNHQKEVEKLNKYVGFLKNISKETIEFVNLEKIPQILSNKISIVTTNIPKLLFINIHKFTLKKYEKLESAKNLFINSEKTNEKEFRVDFKQIFKCISELNIFVDCSKGFSDNVCKIIVNKKLNFVFVLSNEDNCQELEEIIKKKTNESPAKFQINYNWKDLAIESQNLLLQTKINFQNNSQVSLLDLLSCKSEPSTENDLSDVIDPQLLQMMVEKTQIHINSTAEIDTTFEFLFQSRNFIKINENLNNKTKISWKNPNDVQKVLSLPELLSLTKTKRYILISDMAGNGKSWVMKNITKILREQNPTSWVTYVDLKQFIEEFGALEMEPDFSTFMIEKILKLQTTFDAKIFQKLFDNGKIFILFDGFDEIAPKYADVVREVARSLEYNGGNQLWIATRDYFEIDLQKRLHIDVACKLDEFTAQDGINLIVNSWMLMDGTNAKDENLPTYKQKAQKIVQEALMTENLSVGLPQLFKIIIDTNKKGAEVSLKGSQMYSTFLDKLYERWAGEKGQLRKEANTKSQKYKLSFRMIHQFAAIFSLFPAYVAVFFLNYDGSEWPETEIIACGIMSKKDGKFYFLHETFREYLAAEAIADNLNMNIKSQLLIKLFVEILTVEKFGVIRMFLNDLVEQSILNQIEPNVQEFMDNFYAINSFHDFFTKNLEHLAVFVMKILKNGNYEKVKTILNENSWKITTKTKNSNMILKFLDFIFDYLKVEDLAALIKERRIFLGLVESTLNIEHFENFLAKIEGKIGREFIKSGLKLESSDELKGNIFYFLCQSTNVSADKLQKLIKVLQNYINSDEIFNIMTKCNNNYQNILQIYIQIEINSNFGEFFDEIKNFCDSQNFKVILNHKDSENRNILHHIACCIKIEPDVDLWELLQHSFEDKENLKILILENDNNGNNFIHELVKNFNIFPFIESTFNVFKFIFNDAQYNEILTSKNKFGRNILQSVAFKSQSIQVYQFLLDTFEDFHENSQDFMKFLKEVDGTSLDILNIIIQHSSSDILIHTITKLEKLVSHEELKKLLSYVGNSTQNYLQIAAKYNESLEFHKSLWIIFKKYFNESELSQFIYHKDHAGDNLLFVVVMNNSIEVVEFIWNQIKDVMQPESFMEYMLLTRTNGDNLTEMAYDNRKHRKKIFSWVQSFVRKLGANITFGRKDRMLAFAHIYHKGVSKNLLTGGF